MELNPTQKVSKIVARNYRTAAVFTRYGIDFCCNGGIPLTDACSQKQVDINTLLGELDIALAEPSEQDYAIMPAGELIDHIIDTHHSYVEKTIPVLKTYLNKLCTVHGERHPELVEIRDKFAAASIALADHMEKEERILFPFIRAMESADLASTSMDLPHFGHVDNPIAMLEDEHSTEGERFRTIDTLSNNYQAPADGCQTYQVAYKVLQEFEADLHKHIHLENNILFPKAKNLYKELFQKEV